MTFQAAVTGVASAIRPSLQRFGGCSAIARLRHRRCRAGEKISYFGVAHLMEVAIVEADCTHHNEGLERDSLVGLLAELGERLRCGY